MLILLSSGTTNKPVSRINCAVTACINTHTQQQQFVSVLSS
uniref:Uncharacterized protein n=1 Tax=Anguilla anguilla TaxID=7936 RepID=A0A0E9T0B0_ANGAN